MKIISKKPLEYVKAVRNAVSESDIILLDNSFPCILECNELRFGTLNDGSIQEYISTLEQIIEITSESEIIFLIREIYQQVINSYNITRRVLNWERNRIDTTILNAYLTIYSSLIFTYNNHIYKPDDLRTYETITKNLWDIDDTFNLRKVNHKDDGFADGKLVAAAVYEATKGRKTSIITTDGDIGRLLIPTKKLDREKIVVYKRLDSGIYINTY